MVLFFMGALAGVLTVMPKDQNDPEGGGVTAMAKRAQKARESQKVPTLLDEFCKHTTISLDANDDAVPKEYLAYCTFTDMTSNQAIVFGEVMKDSRKNVVEDGIRRAKKDQVEEKLDDKAAVQRAVDWMTCLLGVQVLPWLLEGGHLHAQTLPSLAADSIDGTVEHAVRLVKLYARLGVHPSRVCIKVPATLAGIRACEILSKNGIHTLATVVYSVEQGISAARAGCLYVAPYVNPLQVHFVQGTHQSFRDPMNELDGVKVAHGIQDEYERRGWKDTGVMAASIVTCIEALSLCGLPHVTASPSVLAKLAKVPFYPATSRQEASSQYDYCRAVIDAALKRRGKYKPETEEETTGEGGDVGTSAREAEEGRAKDTAGSEQKIADGTEERENGGAADEGTDKRPEGAIGESGDGERQGQQGQGASDAKTDGHGEESTTTAEEDEARLVAALEAEPTKSRLAMALNIFGQFEAKLELLAKTRWDEVPEQVEGEKEGKEGDAAETKENGGDEEQAAGSQGEKGGEGGEA